MNMQSQSIPKYIKLYKIIQQSKWHIGQKEQSDKKIKPHQDLTTNILSCNLKLKLCERNFE